MLQICRGTLRSRSQLAQSGADRTCSGSWPPFQVKLGGPAGFSCRHTMSSACCQLLTAHMSVERVELYARTSFTPRLAEQIPCLLQSCTFVQDFAKPHHPQVKLLPPLKKPLQAGQQAATVAAVVLDRESYDTCCTACDHLQRVHHVQDPTACLLQAGAA